MGKSTRKVPDGNIDSLPDFDAIINAPQGNTEDLPDFEQMAGGEKKNSFSDGLKSLGDVALKITGLNSSSPSTGEEAGPLRKVIDQIGNDASEFFKRMKVPGLPAKEGVKPWTNGQPLPWEAAKKTRFDKSFLERDIEIETSFSLSDPELFKPAEDDFLKMPGYRKRKAQFEAEKQFKISEIMGNPQKLADYNRKRLAGIDADIKQDTDDLDKMKGLGLITGIATTFFDLPESAATDKVFAELKELKEGVDYANAYKEQLKEAVARQSVEILMPKYFSDGGAKFQPRDIGREMIRIADPDEDKRISDAEAKGHGIPGNKAADLERIGLEAAKSYLATHDVTDEKLEKMGMDPKQFFTGLVTDLESDFDTRNFQHTGNRVREKLGAQIRKGGDQAWFWTGYSEKFLKEVAENPETGLTDSEKKVFYSYVLPIENDIVGTNIPTGGFTKSFSNAIGKSSIGSVNTILGWTGDRTDADRAWEMQSDEEQMWRASGENPNAQAELAYLKQTKGDEQRIKQLENYVGTRTGWQSFLDGTGDITGQVAFMVAGTKGIGATGALLRASGASGGLLGGLTRSALGTVMTNETAAMFMTSYLNANDNYRKSALEVMPGPENAATRQAYAATMAGLEGMTEMIFRDTKVLGAFTKGVAPSVADITKRLMNKEITRTVAKQELQSAVANYAKPFAKEFIKSTGQESTEEAVAEFANHVAEASYGMSEFDLAKAGKETLNAFTTTALHSGIVSGLAGHGAYKRSRSENAFLRSTIMDMGKNPVPYEKMVGELLDKNEITPGEANEKMKLIASANKYLQELPAEKLADYAKATSYLVHRLNEGILTNEIENTTDAVRKGDLEKQLKRSTQLRTGIYDGSISVTPDLQEMTDDVDKAQEMGIRSTVEATEDDLFGTPFNHPVSKDGAMEQMDVNTFAGLQPGDKVFADQGDEIIEDEVLAINEKGGAVVLKTTGVKTQASLDSENFGQRIYKVPATEEKPVSAKNAQTAEEVPGKEKGEVETPPGPKLQTAQTETNEGGDSEAELAPKIPKNATKARKEFAEAVQASALVPDEIKTAVATDAEPFLDAIQQEVTGHDADWSPLAEPVDGAREAADVKYGKEIVDRAMGLLTKKKIREIDRKNRQRLQRDPESFEEAVLQHFGFGGRVSSEEFKRFTGFGTTIERGPNAGKQNGTEEFRKFIWAVSNDGMKPDQWVSDELAEKFGISQGDEHDHVNKIFDILQTYPTRTAMIDRLREMQNDQAGRNFQPSEPEVPLQDIITDEEAAEIVEAGLQDEVEQVLIDVNDLVDDLSDEQVDLLAAELEKYEPFIGEPGELDAEAIRAGLEPFGELWNTLMDAGVSEEAIENLSKYSENDYKQIVDRQQQRKPQQTQRREEEVSQSGTETNVGEPLRSEPPAEEKVEAEPVVTIQPEEVQAPARLEKVQAAVRNPYGAPYGPPPPITGEYQERLRIVANSLKSFHDKNTLGKLQAGDETVYINDELYNLVGIDPDNKDFVRVKNEAGEESRFPMYQSALTKWLYEDHQAWGAHPMDISLINIALGYDNRWNNNYIRDTALGHVQDPAAARQRYDELSAFFSAEPVKKEAKPKGPSNAYIATNDQLTTARENLASRKQALVTKRSELNANLKSDTPDLFGERKPAGSLFDERADATRIDAALEPYRADIQNANAEVKRLELKLKQLEGSTDSELFDQVEEAGEIIGYEGLLTGEVVPADVSQLQIIDRPKWDSYFAAGYDTGTQIFKFLGYRQPTDSYPEDVIYGQHPDGSIGEFAPTSTFSNITPYEVGLSFGKEAETAFYQLLNPFPKREMPGEKLMPEESRLVSQHELDKASELFTEYNIEAGPSWSELSIKPDLSFSDIIGRWGISQSSAEFQTDIRKKSIGVLTEQKKTANRSDKKSIDENIEKLQGEIQLIEHAVYTEQIGFQTDLVEYVLQQMKAKGWEDFSERTMDRINDEMMPYILDGHYIEPNFFKPPLQEISDMVDEYITANQPTTAYNAEYGSEGNMPAPDGDGSVTFKTPSGKVLTGERIVIPGFEDMDTILVSDGMSKLVYEQATGRELASVTGFTEEEVVPQVSEQLLQKGFTAEKLYSKLYSNQKISGYMGRDKGIEPVNDSPAFRAYAEKAQAEEAARPDRYTPEEKQAINGLMAEFEGKVNPKDLEFLARVRDGKTGGAAGYNVPTQPVEALRRNMETFAEQKKLADMKEAGQPWPADKIDLQDDSMSAFRDIINSGRKTDALAKVEPAVVEKIYRAWKKLQAFRNKYGYWPEFLKRETDFSGAMLQYVFDLNGKEKRQAQAPANLVALEQEIERLETAYSKEFGDNPQRDKVQFARNDEQLKAAYNELDNLLNDFSKGISLTSGLDPAQAGKLVKILAQLAKIGYYKLSDMAKFLAEKGMNNVLPYLKEAYRQLRSSNEISHEIKNSLDGESTIDRTDIDAVATGVAGEPGKPVSGGPTATVADRAEGRGGGTRRPPIRVADAENIPTPAKSFVVDGEYEIDEHQRLGANLALNRYDAGGHGFLLADGAGVGKTREILVIAEQFRKNMLQPGESILIVSLANVLADSYVKDAAALNIPLSAFDVATYTDLSAGKVPDKAYGLILWDESHNLKNPLAQKSQAANSLKTRHELFASATPMDQPQHAVYFLSKITDRSPEQMQDELGLHIHYVESPFGGLMPVGKLDVSYFTYLERLIDLRNGAIKAGAMVRREYPFFGTIEAKDYTMPAALAAEVQIVQETHQNRVDKAEYIIQGGRKAGGLPPLEGSDLQVAMEKFIKNERRDEVNNVQKLSEPAKAEQVFNEALRDLSEGRRVIITAENVATTKVTIGKPGSKYHYNNEGITSALQLLEKKFADAGIRVAKIYGGNNATKTLYTEQQNLFQEGVAPVLLMTAKSGGTGINLDDIVGDAPRSLYKLTPNYSGDIFEQVLGRVSRRNTQSPAKVKVMYYLNNISDDSRKQKVQQKVAIIRGIANGAMDIDTERIQVRNEEMGTERPTRTEKPKTIEFVDHEGGKAFFVKGNTFPIADKIKSLGGKWNKFTKAWMFPKAKEEAIKGQVAKAYEDYLNTPKFSTTMKKVELDYDVKAYGSPEQKKTWMQKVRNGMTAWHHKFRLAGENLNLASKYGIDISGLPAGLDLITRRTFADDFTEQKVASHIGYKIKSIADVADIFAVYRSPFVEKTHMVYLKDNQIIHNQAFTQNSPIVTTLVDPYEVLQTAKKLGADQVMILHNHPSGNPEPSRPDIEGTKWYGDIFEGSGIQFAGHIIMNGNRYALLDGQGDFNFHGYEKPQPILIKDRYQLPEDREEMKKEMVKVAYYLLKDTGAHTGIVYLDAEGRVSGYDLVDKKSSPVVVRDVIRRGLNPNAAAHYFVISDQFNSHYDAVMMPAGGIGQVALQAGVRNFAKQEIREVDGFMSSGGGVPPGGTVPPTGAAPAGAPGGPPPAPEVTLDKKSRLETFAKKAKGKAIEYFTVGGGIDQLAREAKQKEIGNFNEWKAKARHQLQAFKKAVKEEYKKLDPATRELADRALKGDNTALQTLHPKTADALRSMREFIDSLTKTMIEEGVIPKKDVIEQQIRAAELAGLDKGVIDQLQDKLALAHRIEANLGRYINRAYLLHRIKDWRDRVPQEKVQKAANYLYEQALLQGKLLSKEQLEEMIEDLLSHRTMDGLMTQSKMEMNLGILKKLKDIPEPLRDVMGQVKDGEWNFMNTAVKMSQLLERHKFLTNLFDAGRGTLFSDIKDVSLGHTERINNFTWGALHGKWAEPELVAQLKHWDKEETDNSIIMSNLRQVNSWAKAAKTTLSVASEMRNLVGNITLTAFNGNFSPKHYVAGFRAIKDIFGKNESPETQAFIEKMNRLRVVGSSLPYYEIKGIMSDLTGNIPDAVDWNKFGIDKILRILSNFKDKLGEVYGATDDIYKIMTFIQERSRLAEAYQKGGDTKTDDEIDEEAADIATRIMPTFAKVPKFVRYFSLNFPLVGTFVSYPTELLRSTWESVRLSIEQLRSPNKEIKKIGAKRLAWQIGVASALPTAVSMAMSALMAALTGAAVPDDDEKEALLEFLPDFYKGVNTVVIRKNGKYYVWLQNSFDGQSWLREIINNGVRGDDASLGESINTFLKPYASGSMPVDKLIQWVKNKDKFDRPIYNDADDTGEKSFKAGKHFGDMVMPQTFYDVKKPIEKFGQGDVTKGELGVIKFLSGQTILQIDPAEAFKWKMKDLDDLAKDLQKKAGSDRYKAGGDQTTIDEVGQELNDAMTELNERRQRLSAAYEKLIKE